ncbi:hypothetical protein Clacol_005665 [Clathrus columnatus]|uniref:Exocyst complex component Sec6 n=1 Tax=Clathrus columnatus TaxID=1419009 RepID=A0AAV5A9Y5_9AGAM|nr:hypothetical protein Clacol_005665 [Clathrus columnatus]
MSVLTSGANAAQAVGEYLQSPDDLMKIVPFRKKLEKEKASIDNKLKNGVKEQLDTTREGLRTLFGTRDNIQTIKDEMSALDKHYRDPQNAVNTFDQISRVSTVHRNFEQVEEMVRNLQEMSLKLDDLADMLHAEQRDILGPATNLLPIHHQLRQLETFRNETLHQAKSAKSESLKVLNRRFERLDKVIADFNAYIAALSCNVLPIVRAGHPEVIVKLCKIAELEGLEDQKAIAIKLLKKAGKMDAASKFKSLQANARQLKHYRSNIMKNISESIHKKFEAAYAKDENNPSAFLDGLEWMYQDINDIENDVTPCFPPDYEIYNFFVREYHKTLNTIIKKLVATEPEASVILHLHAWMKDYRKTMKELNVPPGLMEPPLLDGKDQTLIDDYLNLIVKKLDEWSANIMKTEVKDFIAREQPPEIDADNLYGMQGAIIMFQMVNQQVDLAADSGQGAILARVVEDSNRVMRQAQLQWIKTIESEYKKQVEKTEDAKAGLVEYVIAVANDQIKSADYAEALSARLEPLVSEKYRVVISERLNNAIDGYLDVAKKCTQTLIDLIFNDLKPATKQLFTPTWYNGIMAQIIETFRDYITDYQTHLNPSIFELLLDDLMDTFLITYLTALGNANKLRIPGAIDRIKADVGDAYKFFATFKPPADVQTYFEVVDMVLSLLEASQSLVFLSYWSFAKKHGPCLAFVEGLMKAREDLDRSAVSDVMDSVKRKVKEDGITDPPEPTIMKKVVVQGTFARLLQAAKQ